MAISFNLSEQGEAILEAYLVDKLIACFVLFEFAIFANTAVRQADAKVRIEAL